MRFGCKARYCEKTYATLHRDSKVHVAVTSGQFSASSSPSVAFDTASEAFKTHLRILHTNPDLQKLSVDDCRFVNENSQVPPLKDWAPKPPTLKVSAII